MQAVPLAVPVLLMALEQVRQLPFPSKIWLELHVWEVPLLQVPLVADPVHLKGETHPQEVEDDAYPFEFAIEEHEVHMLFTRIDLSGSQTHALALGLYICPELQVIVSHESAAPFQALPLEQTQPLDVAAPVEPLTVEQSKQILLAETKKKPDVRLQEVQEEGLLAEEQDT